MQLKLKTGNALRKDAPKSATFVKSTVVLATVTLRLTQYL